MQSVATMDLLTKLLKESTGCSVVQAISTSDYNINLPSIDAATLQPARMLGIQDRKGTLNFGRFEV